MIGFDLIPPNSASTVEAANAFMYGCRKRGVHLTYGYGNVNIRIIPPLVITRAQIDFAMEAIEQSLREVQAKGGSGKEGWPSNRYTRRLLEQRPVARLVNHWWRSSPQEWVEKGTELIRRRLTGAKDETDTAVDETAKHPVNRA